MELFNDVVLLNAFIPKLVVLGILCFIITQLSVKFAARYRLLSYFWHPRLIVWAYASAIYAIPLMLTRIQRWEQVEVPSSVVSA